MCFFCFKQKTAYEMLISDWSSDVCSSDLCRFAHHRRAIAVGDDQAGGFGPIAFGPQNRRVEPRGERPIEAVAPVAIVGPFAVTVQISAARSEERRVGKECVRTCNSRGVTYH